MKLKHYLTHLKTNCPLIPIYPLSHHSISFSLPNITVLVFDMLIFRFILLNSSSSITNIHSKTFGFLSSNMSLLVYNALTLLIKTSLSQPQYLSINILNKQGDMKYLCLIPCPVLNHSLSTHDLYYSAIISL